LSLIHLGPKIPVQVSRRLLAFFGDFLFNLLAPQDGLQPNCFALRLREFLISPLVLLFSYQIIVYIHEFPHLKFADIAPHNAILKDGLKN
jgi:hypothetical protein